MTDDHWICKFYQIKRSAERNYDSGRLFFLTEWNEITIFNAGVDIESEILYNKMKRTAVQSENNMRIIKGRDK